ncbi:MAG TPA: esterase family protein [Candidatus Faecousia intestinigallinarum]|nr:esterase family protein [Candidatus Faecousia intestinigallinarum]
MEIQYHKHYSGHLGREMEFKVYGHGGKPVMFIPCQGGRFFDFENFHMIDHWAKWIEEGACTVYAIDSIDGEAYAAVGLDCRRRIENHERWYHYVVDEMVPAIRHLSGLRNGYDQPIMPFGCSMGAMHAANLFFRRPDLFDRVFAISGLYDSKLFFGDYMDDLLYQNTPVEYLSNMPWDHPYISMYNERKILIVVGQGAWEEPLLSSTRWLDSVMRNKGIHAQVDYWGYDVNHDWPWWYKMVEHYVPQLLY